MTDIRKIQLVEKELLKAVVDICEKEHLKYYIIGGTLLGAVRHKGYIPWDDDTDVALPRSDFERFLQVAEHYLCAADGFQLETFRKAADYQRYIPRVTDGHVKMRVSYSTTGRLENVWVDIYPLDGMPSGKLAFKIHSLRLLYHRALFVYSLFSEYRHPERSNRPWYEKFLIWVGYHFPIEKFLNTNKCLESLDKALRRYPAESSKDQGAGVLCAGSGGAGEQEPPPPRGAVRRRAAAAGHRPGAGEQPLHHHRRRAYRQPGPCPVL